MYRVLIADSDSVRACHLEADLLDFEIKAVSVVNGETAVAFCREYDLDLILLDLGMNDARNAVRLLRECESTALIPIMGLGGIGDEMEWEGLCGMVDGQLNREELAQSLRRCIRGGETADEEGVETMLACQPSHGNPLEGLLKLSKRIVELAVELKGSSSEFGQDGPEMFDFVNKSSDQMHQRLTEIALEDPSEQERRLRDREVRHDFRNILASVRGFTDLILMEEGLPQNSVTGLKEICDCSNQFVEWLDAEKHAALNK